MDAWALGLELKGKSVYVAALPTMALRWLRRRAGAGECAAHSVASGEADLRDQAADHGSLPGVRRWCFWRRPRSAALSPTTRCAPNSSTTIWRSANVIQAPRMSMRRKADVPRLLLHLSELAPQPLRDSMLTGSRWSTTNEPYAIAIAGIKMGRPIAASTAPTSSDMCRPTCTARRQLSSRIQPRRRRPDPPFPRSESCRIVAAWRHGRGSSMGHRHACRLARPYADDDRR